MSLLEEPPPPVPCAAPPDLVGERATPPRHPPHPCHLPTVRKPATSRGSRRRDYCVDSSMFESALDWLCFNLPSDEFPLKFSNARNSTTSSLTGAEASVKVLSTAKDNWVPQSREPEEVKVSTEGLKVRIGGWRDENVSLDDGQFMQAAWIRQYMEQHEEVWEATSGAKQFTFEGHEAPVYSVCPHYKENIQVRRESRDVPTER